MNVFILSTGRCGSMTFAKACSFINNYTSAHESRNYMSVSERLKYPDNHIESDNRLSWFLGKLDIKYGDNAIYIHLMRDKYKTSFSYSKRYWPNHIMEAYKSSIYYNLPIESNEERLELAMDYYDTVNTNIRLFLKDKTNKMEFHLENADDDFKIFWKLINAEGDLNSALKVFGTKFNTNEENIKQINNKSILNMSLIKFYNIIRKLPKFINNA